eukprot:CAMPEP_0175077644 /NCGR_PEP_ID=MMETSP0052_2-20121109/23533_1 /TAXON_ID=51329 ORGANISM="Polytomella parva, Strain SAG 63-3" /NCGR_SAMPLE_ID=MMETSP0052_2 /ASSEMBLY_ACC=CAM_ASM_000194 /LENGTH=88 /DNA_ID=CAMNT_0016347189 /DNA_START=12 /DNA_END=275 /DNA_ORIENTATION=+
MASNPSPESTKPYGANLDPRLAEQFATLDDLYGPSIWESAAHVPVPDSAWEFHLRRSLNDAAYSSLDYVPYCSTMPVQKKCDQPKFMW